MPLRVKPTISDIDIFADTVLPEPRALFGELPELDPVVHLPQDVAVPAGARSALLYGSANPDERNRPQPDVFELPAHPVTTPASARMKTLARQ